MSSSAEDSIKRILKESDYYSILDLPKDCDVSLIKKQYRKLALLLHPDKCSIEGCEDAFKKFGGAYKCLSSPDDRKMYDMTGQEGNDGGMQSNPFGRGGGGGMHGGLDPEEIFRQFFAQNGGVAGAFNSSGNDNPFMHSAFGPGIRIHSFGGGNPFMHFQQQQQQQRRPSPSPSQQQQTSPLNLPIPSYLQYLKVIPQYVPMQLLVPVGMFTAIYCFSILMQNFTVAFLIMIFVPSKFKIPCLGAVILLNAFGLWQLIQTYLYSFTGI